MSSVSRRRVGILAAATTTAFAAALVGPATASGTVERSAQAAPGDPVNYGDVITLENQHGGSGGYLDTRNAAGVSGAKYGVSTATKPNRDNGSGRWKIVNAADAAKTGRVNNGDVVQLVNQYNGGRGGYLDANQPANMSGSKYKVYTTDKRDRDSGSGQWTVMATSGQSGPIVEGGGIHLLNRYKDNGGFLDTRNHATDGNKYGVVTSNSWDRDKGSGTWKVGKVG
ncbi:hypothetical protein [Streptomyces boluensis]|uniref:Uncharacterized protein n=1 Tax=Streptomyces boluensis TaxID=1775135 RepID=A0A964UPJ0_9ACTN|nr:hypothetical protein [Streptomyces boluensis]NBE53058.1 hypothetical protein [Streptomyces boluensis]